MIGGGEQPPGPTDAVALTECRRICEGFCTGPSLQNVGKEDQKERASVEIIYLVLMGQSEILARHFK